MPDEHSMNKPPPSVHRTRGRPPLPAADRHGQRINVNLTAAQIEALDAVRGDKARGEWVREIVADALTVWVARARG
jgi:hypothetical protein